MTKFDTNTIANIVAQVIAAMNVPKTSAKVKSTTGTKAAKRTTTGHSRKASADANGNVAITLTDAMLKGRMVLPNAMFGGNQNENCSKIVVNDDITINRDFSNNGRSMKVNPKVFGRARVGRTIHFEFERETTTKRDGNVRFYSATWTGKGQSNDVPEPTKAKTKTASVPKTTKAKAKATKTADVPKPTKAKYVATENEKAILACKSYKALIETTAAIAIDNEAQGIENPNIKASNTFRNDEGQDSRDFLPRAESQAFRRQVKAFGKSMYDAVEDLNNEFNEYE